MSEARLWVERLSLRPHPEGGHYRETYRAAEAVAAHCLPPRFGGARSFSTAIYFLLEAGQFSALHRLKQDEAWHYYAGGPLLVHDLAPDGTCTVHQLGLNFDAGERPQAVVPAGHVFGATVEAPFALVGCTVAPGFDFADFEMPGRAELVRLFPKHRALIERLTRA
jgi:predicted cupin superfamily sugar epimerase